MLSAVDDLEIDVLVVDVLELDVLGARRNICFKLLIYQIGSTC
jgi:hypothetical protein